jgi:hypothetical protein
MLVRSFQSWSPASSNMYSTHRLSYLRMYIADLVSVVKKYACMRPEYNSIYKNVYTSCSFQCIDLLRLFRAN